MEYRRGKRGRILRPPQTMGFFNWMVAEGLLYGDAMFAELYELCQDDLTAGVDVMQILAKIVEEDRPIIARNIHQAILSAEPSGAQYRIHLANGQTRDLVSFGRCFHDKSGAPTFYTGAVMDARSDLVVTEDDPFQAHCSAALHIAREQGNELASRYLASALNSVSP